MADTYETSSVRAAHKTASTVAADDAALVVADPNLKATLALLLGDSCQPDLTAAAAAQQAIGTSTAKAATGLTVGTKYAVYATAPCFVKVGDDASTAALTDVYLEPGLVFCWTPTADDTDDNISVIAAVAGGTLYVQACQ